MIVLNGMPFLPFNLRAIYPFAHQIVVAEGAAPGAAAIAALDGHSRDGTLDELRRFAREEDSAGKLVIVTAEDEGHASGFWPGEKDEQSRAYATRATGDYLWQVDVDEFYLPEGMQVVCDMLRHDPGISAVTFPTRNLWADPAIAVDGWFLRRGAAQVHRVFKWGQGSRYLKHRPPVVVDAQGRDTHEFRWMDAHEMRRRGVWMYHYSLWFPAQVREKVEYYSSWGLHGEWFAGERRWLADAYLTLRKPFRAHNVYRYPSWLERYGGPHPPEIGRLMAAVDRGQLAIERRPLEDAEVLLRSPWYALGRRGLKVWGPVDHWARRLRWSAGPLVRRLWHKLIRGDARP